MTLFIKARPILMCDKFSRHKISSDRHPRQDQKPSDEKEERHLKGTPSPNEKGRSEERNAEDLAAISAISAKEWEYL